LSNPARFAKRTKTSFRKVCKPSKAADIAVPGGNARSPNRTKKREGRYGQKHQFHNNDEKNMGRSGGRKVRERKHNAFARQGTAKKGPRQLPSPKKVEEMVVDGSSIEVLEKQGRNQPPPL